MRMYVNSALAVLLSSLSGCYAADLDAALEGVYACRVDDGSDPDADCPDGLLCDGSACVSQLPIVEVRSPEEREAFEDPGDVVIRVAASGLDLNAEAGEPGAGFVRVTLDEQSVDIREGALSDSVVVEFEIPDTPGGHRISAQAFRLDETPYRNPGATDASLYWIDDGLPHVAITKPWPGSNIDIGTPLVEFEAALLNIEYALSDTEPADGEGHVHIYYDDAFPACALDPICDAGYIAVIAAAPGEGRLPIADTAATVPQSAETAATVTAMLRQNDHDPFCINDDEADADCPETADQVIVTDAVTVDRVSLR